MSLGNLRNFQRVHNSQPLYKFHFHESVLFRLEPQSAIINRVILRNDVTKLIDSNQESSLQRSFNNIFKNRDNEIGSWANNKCMNRLFSQVYYPFLSKSQLEQHFKESKNLSLLKNFIMKHSRLKKDAFRSLMYINEKPMFDFGIIRSSYFPSIGLLNDYHTLLKNTNFKLFRYHSERDFSFSKPLSDTDNRKNEEILATYFESSAELHRGVGNIKNYLVIDKPDRSEFFISLANKLGNNVVIITDSHFTSPSSTIGNLIDRYSILKKRGKLLECQQVHHQLSSMKLITVSNIQEFIKMLDILQDPYVRLPATIATSLSSDGLSNTLKEMELSILGDIETKYSISVR